MTYKTHQRSLITDFLKKESGHITAELIAVKLKESGTPVGLTTVYRALSSLEKSGQVRKFIADGCACYQYIDTDAKCCSEHLHFKCDSCGKLFHVDCDILKDISSHVKSDHNFTLNSSKTVFYGTCGACTAVEGK